jgi:hypothetical protein
MAWKDIILLLTQTLTTLEKQWVTEETTTVGSNYYLSQSKSQQKEQKIPRGRSGNASK